MTIKIYRMKFDRAHFGDGHLNQSQLTFTSSRLYSALFLEALHMNKAEEFFNLTNQDDFVLSDAFPYIDGQPFLPKPIGYPKMNNNEVKIEELKKLRSDTKKIKKIVAIPFDKFDDFINKKADILYLVSQQSKLGQSTVLIRKGENPYEVALTSYQSEVYVLANQSDLLDELMESLQYSGLGGKRSSGYGRFDLTISSLPDDLSKRITNNTNYNCMLLSTSIPTNDELNNAIDDEAAYLLSKSSGYIYSETASKLIRKRNLYKFAAGSTFSHSYYGSIVDVRPDNFLHPVWNFSKGLFYILNNKEGADL